MQKEFTRLLKEWRSGEGPGADRLGELVYGELHRLARQSMRHERNDHTLQPTALVNEAFIRLQLADVDFSDRCHFYALAGRMMRRVLVDHARCAQREKRGGGVVHVSLDTTVAESTTEDTLLLELDDALSRLAQRDARKAEILELQYFAGLTAKEIASVIGVSSRTVERDARFARAWIGRELDAMQS